MKPTSQSSGLPALFKRTPLVLRQLDIRKALDRVGGDYLVVTSPSNLHAILGESFSHQIEALSKAGGIRCTVAQGPDGLAIPPTGKLTRLPPKTAGRGDLVTAIIMIADSTATERFHTLRIGLD
jgi:hypothetical protein